MKLFSQLLVVAASVQAQDRHECIPCNTCDAETQKVLTVSWVPMGSTEEGASCGSCQEYECEDCEICPGKKDLECPEDFKAMNDGNHMTNCDVKCKDWKCGPCDTCEDVVEECDAGFHSVLTGAINCDCGKEASEYGCECTPCESTGPTAEECTEDQKFEKTAVYSECADDKCWDRSCVACDSCPEYPVVDCPAEGKKTMAMEELADAKCAAMCPYQECVDCECPTSIECAEGEIEVMETCEEFGECDECNCDVFTCRTCVDCQDVGPVCEEFEMQSNTNTTMGECGDTCNVFECVCAEPCMDQVEPFCDSKDKLHKWMEADACSNECIMYECESKDPEVALAALRVEFDDHVTGVFNGTAEGFVTKMIGKFELYADQALVTYGELNGQEGCHFYGDFEVEEMEENDEEDADVGGERAVDAGCQDTADGLRNVVNNLRKWAKKYNMPCDGSESRKMTGRFRKMIKLRKMMVKRACPAPVVE